MDTALPLVNLAGLVALLLWGVHMVQTGIQRVFGPGLRRFLGSALGNRLKAFFVGLGVTAVLQSSTATGLMVAGFAADGMVGLVPALAVMLGANVGTTLIVQILSFDVSIAAPALILIGVMMFRRATEGPRDFGRVLIGLGLMLLALRDLLELVTPYEDLPSLRLLLGAVSTQPLLAILLAAGLTWAAHSSVAVVIFVMSLAAKGIVPPNAAFALVLGANLGTAINPCLEGAPGDDPVARRLPVGNLLNRIVGVGLALAALPLIGREMVVWQPDNARAVADFHTAFNLAMALLFLPLLTPFAALLRRLLPARVDPLDPARPVYLDPAARETPVVALGSATREALRLADTLEVMIQDARDAVQRGGGRRMAEAKRLDDVLDQLNTAIKTYVTALDPDAMAEPDHQRVLEILTFAANIEYAGDTVDRGIRPIITKLAKRGLTFSDAERDEIVAVIDRLLANLRTAASVFTTGDERAARLLAAEKEWFRNCEARGTDSHFERLRLGQVEHAEVSSLHLDLLRELKNINTYLVAGAAYPLLDQRGELLPSRLRASE